MSIHTTFYQVTAFIDIDGGEGTVDLDDLLKEFGYNPKVNLSRGKALALARRYVKALDTFLKKHHCSFGDEPVITIEHHEEHVQRVYSSRRSKESNFQTAYDNRHSA